jgi:hypothetical protein
MKQIRVVGGFLGGLRAERRVKHPNDDDYYDVPESPW